LNYGRHRHYSPEGHDPRLLDQPGDPERKQYHQEEAYEAGFLNLLKKECRIKSVVAVSMHEPLTNLRKLIVIQMKEASESEIWRALRVAANRHQGVGKVVIAVDEDIDPENADALWWAICYRSKPHRDMEILKYTERGHGPPFHFTAEARLSSPGEG
jgi:4-hydroxy-3-polyprenylbenzoate decarboxylase